MYVIISIGTSLPVNQTNHTWPCRRDQNVRRELSEAQHKSLELSDIITDLGKNMVRVNSFIISISPVMLQLWTFICILTIY